MSAEVLFSVMPVTATSFSLTVMKHVALWPPQDAVIVTVPALCAVTRPLYVTLAISGSEEVQIIFWSVAFDGSIVASSCREFPTFIPAEVLSRVSFVTGIVAGLMEMEQVALLPPARNTLSSIERHLLL